MKKQDNHPDYDLYLPYWLQIRTFARGMKDVQNYLQNITNDTSPAGVLRNKNYKERAKYTNFSARTRNALVGSVFRVPAKVELPSGLEYLEKNANGNNMTLEQLSKGLITNLIEIGRHGLFVDYGTSAKIVGYSAENIINWDCNDAGELEKVILKKGKDDYKHLIIDDNGYYLVEIYDDEELQEAFYPTKADGSKFKEIPFIFCGSTDNAPDVDDMPLWPIVDVSQGHYQNSADYEDLLRFIIPTPAITVPNKPWMDDMLPSGVYTFGDGSIIPLPDGGSATLLQANENQMHAKAMEHKENQLIALGARIITGNTGQAETAEAVRIRYSSENSILDNLVGNASDSIVRCLQWCGEFMGVKGDIAYELNREYFDTSMSPQEITAKILLLDRGVIAKTDLRNSLRKAGDIDLGRTDEIIDGEISDSGGGLDDRPIN